MAAGRLVMSKVSVARNLAHNALLRCQVNNNFLIGDRDAHMA